MACKNTLPCGGKFILPRTNVSTLQRIYQHSTISSEDAAAALITEKLRKMKWASIAYET